MFSEPVYNTAEVADLLRITEVTLRKRRARNYKGPPGPPFFKMFGRVLYKKSEFAAWAAKNSVSMDRSPKASTALRPVPPAPPREPAA